MRPGGAGAKNVVNPFPAAERGAAHYTAIKSILGFLSRNSIIFFCWRSNFFPEKKFDIVFYFTTQTSHLQDSSRQALL